MDAHELVAAIKDLAIELGTAPTRAECEIKVKGFRYKLERLFNGSHTALLAACGIDPYEKRRSKQKIGPEIFEKNIEQHLEEYSPRELPASVPGKYQKTLFIGDLHAPFANLPLLEKIYSFARIHQPEVIVQIGDLYDFLSHGRFPRSHNTFSAREEQQLGRKQAETMWLKLKEAAPKARCVQLWGNHDARPLKRILEAYPEAEDWVSEMVTRLMTFDGVKTLEDFREELMLPGDVMVHHGYRSRLGQHRDYAHLNAVVGHTHTGGVVYKQIRGKVLWELNCGLAGDQNAKGLTYTNQRLSHWTPGFGYLDEFGPRFIPFNGGCQD